MSLRHAILGMLTREPMSGYQIKATFRESIRNFWNVSDGQLYPTLNKLSADGLVDKEELEQSSGLKKHVYTLTERGRGEFHDWLSTPEETLPELKEPFLLKMIFFDQLDKKEIVPLIRSHLEATEAMLAEIRDVRAEKRKAEGGAYENVVHDLALLLTEARVLFLAELARAVEDDTLDSKLQIFDDDLIELGRQMMLQMLDVLRHQESRDAITELLHFSREQQ